jgi:hypothetical protein
MSIPKSWTIALAAVAVLGVCWRLWPSDAPEAVPMSAAAGLAAAAASGLEPARAPGPADNAVVVVDAHGLRLDAARLFEIGFAGGLVIDGDTRAAIEAVLNSLPPEPGDADLARLERTLREGLPREDAERAMKLFADYRAYTKDVHEQMEPLGIPGNLTEANAFFDKMDALKRQHFGDATAQALFGQHDAHARITMEAGFISQDQTLSPDEKKERLEALRARLPPEQRSLIPVEGSASQPVSG